MKNCTALIFKCRTVLRSSEMSGANFEQHSRTSEKNEILNYTAVKNLKSQKSDHV
jgi:hypothetical protein